MKKVLKVLAVIIVLIVAALIVIPIIFKDDIVKMVKDLANENVNAKVEFGDFDLSLIKSFPNFYFSIQDIKVIGVDEFDGLALADIGEVALTVDVMSIINGETIKVKKIKIDRANLTAKVLADGKANWDIAKVDTSAVEEVPEEVVETDTSGGFQLALEQLQLINSTIIYDDATFPMFTELRDINFEMTGDLSEDLTTITLDGGIAKVTIDYDGVKYIKEAKFTTALAIAADMVNSKYTIDKGNIALNELELGMEGWLAMLEDESQDMDLKFTLTKTDIRSIISLIPAEFAKDMEGIKTTGKVQLDGFFKGKYIGESYPAFGMNLLMQDGSFSYTDLPESIQDIQIDTKVASTGGDLDNMVVDVNRFHFSMANNPFDLTAHIKNPMTDTYIDAGAKGKIILDNVKDMIPMEEGEEIAGTIDMDVQLKGRVSTLEKEDYENFNASGKMLVSQLVYKTTATDYPIAINNGNLVFDTKSASLKSLDMILGGSDIAMNGQLSNFVGYALSDNQTLKGSLNVISNKLDITELMGSEEEAASSAETVAETPSEGTTATDTAAMEVALIPKFIDFVMTVDVKQMIYDDIDMRNFKGSLGIKDQKLDFNKVGLDILDGHVAMDGYYETTDSLKPTYAIDFGLDKLDLNKTAVMFTTVDKLMPLAKKTVGKFSAQMFLQGDLDTKMEPIYNTVNGKGKISTDNIEIKDVKALEKIADALKYDKIRKMKLQDVNVSFAVVNGKVFTEPFDIKLDKSKVTIAGSSSLDQTIDYTMAFAIPREELGGEANKAIDGLLSQANKNGLNIGMSETINIDVKVVGTMDDPKITTDFKKMAGNAVQDAKQQIKEEINKEIDKQKEELERKAREEAERLKKEAEAKAKEEADKLKKELEEKGKKEMDKLKEDAAKKLKGLFK